MTNPLPQRASARNALPVMWTTPGPPLGPIVVIARIKPFERGSDAWLASLALVGWDFVSRLIQWGVTPDEALLKTWRQVIMPLRVSEARANFLAAPWRPCSKWPEDLGASPGIREARARHPAEHLQEPKAPETPLASLSNAPGSVTRPAQTRRFVRGRPRPGTPRRTLPFVRVVSARGYNRETRRRQRRPTNGRPITGVPPSGNPLEHHHSPESSASSESAHHLPLRAIESASAAILTS